MLRRAYPLGFQLLVTLAYLITSHFSLLTNHPCLCLWRGFLQITRTTFLRFTILQLAQILFTDGRTFIICEMGHAGAAGHCHFRR